MKQLNIIGYLQAERDSNQIEASLCLAREANIFITKKSCLDGSNTMRRHYLRSFTNSHQELTDHIVPKEYYDRYPLVFSHFHLDRIIVRIGMNEKQRKAITDRQLTNNSRAYKQMDDSWYSSDLPRAADYLQQQIVTSEISESHNLLN